MQVLSIILPLRYDLVRFGGSWAQRQVFTVTVIEAAVRAKQVPLALALVAELKVMYSLGTLTAFHRCLPFPLSLPPSPGPEA